MFWYLMPVLAVYVIGQGAVDFVRLFFNRSNRRDAWEEAVASTYRNHVIIIGLGHVGERVMYTLVAMGFDVVAIELEMPDELDKRLNALGADDYRGCTPVNHAGKGGDSASQFADCLHLQ